MSRTASASDANADDPYLDARGHHRAGRLDAAAAGYERVVALDAAHAGALTGLGTVHLQRGAPRQAVRLLARSLRLQPGQPIALNNLGAALEILGRPRVALAQYEKSIALESDCVDSHMNRAGALFALGQAQAALTSYEHVTALEPQNAEAQLKKALLLLRTGDFERGWPLYEWRWKGAELALVSRRFTQPLWLGAENLAGKTILLHAEQGLGDSIQFGRYVALVERTGARVVVEIHASLVRLFDSVCPGIRVVARGGKLPGFDFQCPFMSLPLAFGTTLTDIPAPVRFHVAGTDRDRWMEALGPRRKPRIGIVWSGNAAHRDDRNRSIALETLRPLFSLDAEFHSLQAGARESDEAALKMLPQLRVWDADLYDTAALALAMDVVVSVDTSVAHLAASLGKPTWILISRDADFRWLLDRDDSPWYPTARLFRQARAGDWPAVIERVDEALRSLCAATKP